MKNLPQVLHGKRLSFFFIVKDISTPPDVTPSFDTVPDELRGTEPGIETVAFTVESGLGAMGCIFGLIAVKAGEIS